MFDYFTYSKCVDEDYNFMNYIYRNCNMKSKILRDN